MSPLDIVLAAWLAFNVLTVLFAMKWSSSKNRRFRLQARQMVEAAEDHANAARPVRAPVGAPRT
jgi:hypothetical protein